MQTTQHSQFNNRWYKPGSKVKIAAWYLVNAVFFKSGFMPVSGLKVFLLRLFGATIGQNVVIKPRVNIKYPWLLSVGHYTWIGEEVWIDNLAQTSLGENVCLSQGAMLLCGNHNYKKSSFDLVVRPISLENGVWIGAKAVVCPGVVASSHALLTVGSVATSNLEPYGIYQGNPAVKIKQRVIE
ncbi:MAG: WcaF family extracellular polysaccharide biosynthesis acetyltransferase [Luteibaculaceae bacterium]